MADHDNMINLKAALNKENSKKQINQDIKSLEKTINQLHLVAALYKGESKNQINSAIEKLESKVNVIRLRADFDRKQAKKEVNDALNNLSIKDIKINEQGMRLKTRKLVNALKTEFSKISISPKIDVRKEQLQKQLSGFLNKNSRIQDSSYLSNQAKELNEFFASIDSNDSLALATDRLELFKSEVEAAGLATAAASDKITGLFKKVTKAGSKLELVGLGIEKYIQTISEFSFDDSMQSADSLEGRLNTLQYSWNQFFSSVSNQNYLNTDKTFLDITIKGFKQLKDSIGTISDMLDEINNTTININTDTENSNKPESIPDRIAEGADLLADGVDIFGEADPKIEAAGKTLHIISKLISFGSSIYKRIKEANQIAKQEAITQYNSSKDELEKINSELETQSNRLNELQKKSKLTYVEKSELANLQAITSALKEQQAIHEKITDTKAKKVTKTSLKATIEDYNNNFTGGPVSDETISKYNVSAATDLPDQAFIGAVEGNTSNLSAMIAAYEVLLKKSIDNKNIDTELSKINEQQASELKDKIENKLYSLYEYKKELESFPYEDLKPDEKATLKEINNSIITAWEHTDSNQWNSLKIDEIFDQKGIEKTKDELMALAKAGKLDENTILSYYNLNEAIKNSGLILKDGETSLSAFINSIQTAANNSTKGIINSVDAASTSSMIDKLNSLNGGFHSINSVMENPLLLNDDGFTETFSGYTQEYSNFIEALTQSPDEIDKVKSAYNDLLAVWLNSSGVFDTLTDNNKNLLISLLTNMGVMNAEALVTDNLLVKQEHLAAQKAYTAEMSQKLSNATSDEIPNIIEEATDSDVAAVALAGLALAKRNANGTTLDTSGDIDNVIALIEVIGTRTTALKALRDQKNKKNKTFHDGLKEIALTAKGYKEILDSEKKAQKYKGKGSKPNNTNPPPPGDSPPKENKSYTPKSITNFNWFDRQSKLLNDKRSELLDKSSSTFIDYLGLTQDEFNRAQELINSNDSSTSSNLDELSSIAQKAGLSMGELYSLISQGSPNASKRNYLSQILEVDKSLLDSYDGAVKEYKSEYDKAINDVKPEYRAKIKNGDTSIDTLTGDEADKVQKAITARDKYTDTINKQYKMEQNYIADTMALYESKSKSIENQNKQIENTNSLLNKQMDYYKSAGEIVDSSFYEKLISNTGDEITNTEALLANKQEELNKLRESDVSETAEEYVKLKGEITDTKEKTYSLKKAQEEYNNQLLQLPIDNLSTVISMYKDINTTMKNWASEVEASGEKLDSSYYQSMITNGSTIIDQYKEQASAIQEVMDHYNVGSDNWNKLYGKLQNVNSEMSSMVQNLYKWNEALLKMPMDNINNYSSELQKITDGLNQVKSEYDTVISSVTSALNDQIDAINKQKDAANEEYEASKKPLQDKLDLLNKQNEELKLQQTYEQSLYKLQQANQQATEKVIRNGQVVYEQDADKLREAQEAVQDAKYDLETHNIQSQIDSLQETLDGLNGKYQDQIDSLQKISDKWSEISEKITQAQNEAKAGEILGSDWKNKVLSGNDTELFNNLSGMYTDISRQIKQYQVQIDTTNNIYSLLEDYIASYKDGSLSYEKALNGINGLLAQLNQTMTANGNLQNIFDYLSSTNGTEANADSLLNGIQQGLTTTADELVKSLEQYRENSGIISEYTSSWQQLTNNVSTMLNVLKEVRDNLEDASDDDEEDDHDKENGAPYMGGEYVDSGPGVEQRKSGLVNGLVGTSSASDREIKMKLMGLKKLAPDEIPALLHKKEAVINTDQQDTLLRNFAVAYDFVPAIPNFRNMLHHLSTGKATTTQEFNFNGGIHIQECNDADELAQGILNGGLRNAFIQETGKR